MAERAPRQRDGSAPSPRGPSFRSSVLVFLAMTVVVAAAATSLLILLDPRSQVWWSDRVAEAAALIQSLISFFRGG